MDEIILSSDSEEEPVVIIRNHYVEGSEAFRRSADRIDKIRRNPQQMEQSTSQQKPIKRKEEVMEVEREEEVMEVEREEEDEEVGRKEEDKDENKELIQKILKVIDNGKKAKPTYLCQILETDGQTKETELESEKISKKMLTEFKKSMKSPWNREEAKLYRIEVVTDMRFKDEGPEYLIKWQGYVKKKWEPLANLNTEGNEENKKCILDLAKTKHKIGQPMEGKELNLAFQQVEDKLHGAEICECKAKKLKMIKFV